MGGTSLLLILNNNSNKVEINLEKSACQAEALEIYFREMISLSGKYSNEDIQCLGPTETGNT